MPELFACTCIKHISTNVMKLQATLKQISMKKKNTTIYITIVICIFTSFGRFFFISDIYNFRETAGCSVASGLYPKFHEAIFLITLKYTFYF